MSDRGTRVAAVLFGLAGIVTLVLVLGGQRILRIHRWAFEFA